MFSIIFQGKFETPDQDKFMSGLEKLAKETNTKIEGNFQVHQFVEFEEIEDSDVQVLDENAKEESNRDSDVSN